MIPVESAYAKNHLQDRNVKDVLMDIFNFLFARVSFEMFSLFLIALHFNYYTLKAANVMLMDQSQLPATVMVNAPVNMVTKD